MRPENINRGGPKKWVPSAIREADKDKRIAELEAELRSVANSIAFKWPAEADRLRKVADGN